MAKSASFNFGANKKSSKKSSGKKSSKSKGTGRGSKSQAWRAYTSGGISNAPIPD